LSNTQGTTPGTIEIQNETYNIKNVSVEDFLGYSVKFYYKESPNMAATSEIIYIYSENKNKDILISSDELVEYKDYTYSYYMDVDKSGSILKQKISPTADVIYNGKALIGVKDDAILTPDVGTVTLIDNDNNGTADVVKIMAKTIMFVSSVDTVNTTFYDMLDTNNKVKLELNNSELHVNIHTSNGQEMKFSDIEKWDVAEVIQSEGKEISEIVINREVVSGTITAQKKTEGRQYIVINSVTYRLTNALVKYMETRSMEFKVGDSLKIFLSENGEVAGFDKTAIKSESGEYGYLIQSTLSNGLKKELSFKILNQDGKLSYLNSAEKIQIDMAKRLTNEQAEDKLKPILRGVDKDGNAIMTPVVVYYEKNADGAVTYIDTPRTALAPDEDGTLYLVGKTNNEKCRGEAQTISGKINYDDTSKVFLVPAKNEGATGKEYDCKKALEYLINYENYTLSGYAREKHSAISRVITNVSNAASAYLPENNLFLLQEVATSITEDGEKCYVLYGIEDGTECSYKVLEEDVFKKPQPFDSGSAINPKEPIAGDILRLTLNNQSEVIKISMIYSSATSELYMVKNPNGSNVPAVAPSTNVDDLSEYYNLISDFNARFRVHISNLYYKDDKYVRLVNPIFNLQDPKVVELIENGTISIESHKKPKTYIYDPIDGQKPFRVASIGEAYDYIGNGKSSKVLMYTDDGMPRSMVILDNGVE
ncbi:MAG: hypothetical protein RR145_01605, partial [Oscillospiraceae bacterium]